MAGTERVGKSIDKSRGERTHRNWRCWCPRRQTRSSVSSAGPPCPRRRLLSVSWASSWRSPSARSGFRYRVRSPGASEGSPACLRPSCWWAPRCSAPSSTWSPGRPSSRRARPPGRNPPGLRSPVDCGSPAECCDNGSPCARWTARSRQGGTTPCMPRIGRCLGMWCLARFPLENHNISHLSISFLLFLFRFNPLAPAKCYRQ